MGDSVDNYSNATKSDIMIQREIIRAEFYNTYDVMTGIRIASTLGGFFLMMVLLVLYKSKCKTRSLSDQHLEAVIKAAVDQEEHLAALAKRSSSSSYCSGHGLCRCSPRFSITDNNASESNNWNRRSKNYLSDTQYHPYLALSQTNNKLMKSSVLEYSFEEDEDDDMEDTSGNNGYQVAKWLEVPNDKKWIQRGNSAITVSSNDTSYLEARGSSLIIGHPPSPLNHPPPAGDPPWEFYYPIDIQVIQPTPYMSPSGSQDSFSDVPKHTQQLLPERRSLRDKREHQQRLRDHRGQRSRSPPTAPIASMRTSCASCGGGGCDDAVSTATTVNSSVFADDYCCCDATADSPLLPQTAAAAATHDPADASTQTLCRRRCSSPTADGRRYTSPCADVYESDDDGGGRVVRAFRPEQAPSLMAAGGRNVIVVQADVNPAADSIVNANSLTGSLRALYDASKETLF